MGEDLEDVGNVDPSGVANLHGLLELVGMAPRMGAMGPVRAHSVSRKAGKIK